MQIAIISDTHLPRGSRALPQACVERLRTADHIIHAGDIATVEVLEQVRGYGPPVTAVFGNVDDAGVRALLPEVAILSAGRWRIAVVHDGGPAAGRRARMRRRFPDADTVVFGHSHIPLYERGDDGFAIFNPGSPTDRRRQPHHTMGICEAGAELRFELITLD